MNFLVGWASEASEIWSNSLFSGRIVIGCNIAYWILIFIVHVGFAFAVLADSGLMWRHFRRNTFLVGGAVWALATLLGGVFVVAVYWLVHHSTLRPPQRTDVPRQEPELHQNRQDP